ncbi:MAG: metallophosphoesterase family protein [Haloferacaceae archaeon]
MEIGIVSDTHDDLDAAGRAADLFADRADAVVHCGDVVSPFAAAPFDAGFDFHCIAGNNEGEPALIDAVEAFGTHHGECAELAFDGRTVAVYHGTAGPLVDALVDSGAYDYVCHGHTHEHGREERGGTVRINPGGLPIPGADDAFHVATLDATSGDVTFHELG